MVYYGLRWFLIGFNFDDNGIMMGEDWDINGYTLW